MPAHGDPARTRNHRPRPAPLFSHERGFTLFELLVAVAILALVTGIAFPTLEGLLARRSMDEARGVVALTVARARSAAIGRDLPISVTLVSGDAGQGDQLVLSGGLASAQLPAGAVVDWPHGSFVVFGDGSSNGATGAIHAGTAISRFAVEQATARTSFAP